jgi:hypothetical protein
MRSWKFILSLSKSFVTGPQDAGAAESARMDAHDTDS